MDPISLLVSALVAGATDALGDTASTAVNEAYAKLKEILARKFGAKSALATLEEKPESQMRQAVIREDLQNASAAEDDEVMRLAQAVIAAIERDKPEPRAPGGIDLSRVKAGSLEVSQVHSEGTGVTVRDGEFSGKIKIVDVRAGKTDPPSR